MTVSVICNGCQNHIKDPTFLKIGQKAEEDKGIVVAYDDGFHLCEKCINDSVKCIAWFRAGCPPRKTVIEETTVCELPKGE